jgi:SAM-dependent methyltransferase
LPKLPPTAVAGLKAVDRRLPWTVVYRGNSVECPCCGESFRRFRRHWGRPNARCPRCASLERHRLLWLWLRGQRDIFEERLDLLHFAPEAAFEARLSALPNLRYVGADLLPKGDQVRVDIMDIHFDDASFDVILCNHVLGEVPDDRRAITELHRVLRPGGRLIAQMPVDHDRVETTERDRPVQRPGEPQPTGANVRIYGRDFVERLAAPGFAVEEIRYLETVPQAERRRYALEEVGGEARGNDIYVATRSASEAGSPPLRPPA